MDAGTLLAFSLAYLLAVATPGLSVTALVARALGSGFVPALPMIAGLVLGDLLYLSFAALGLSVIIAQAGPLFLLIKWAGVAYLLYMAWSLWTAPAEAPVAGAQAAGSPARAFLMGLSVTLGNPKVIVFFLALLPTLVDLDGLTLVGFLELAGLTAALLTMVLTGYAALAARARRLFRSTRAIRIVNRGAGVAMAGAAVTIAAR